MVRQSLQTLLLLMNFSEDYSIVPSHHHNNLTIIMICRESMPSSNYEKTSCHFNCSYYQDNSWQTKVKMYGN